MEQSKPQIEGALSPEEKAALAPKRDDKKRYGKAKKIGSCLVPDGKYVLIEGTIHREKVKPRLNKKARRELRRILKAAESEGKDGGSTEKPKAGQP